MKNIYTYKYGHIYFYIILYMYKQFIVERYFFYLCVPLFIHQSPSFLFGINCLEYLYDPFYLADIYLMNI